VPDIGLPRARLSPSRAAPGQQTPFATRVRRFGIACDTRRVERPSPRRATRSRITSATRMITSSRLPTRKFTSTHRCGRGSGSWCSSRYGCRSPDGRLTVRTQCTTRTFHRDELTDAVAGRADVRSGTGWTVWLIRQDGSRHRVQLTEVPFRPGFHGALTRQTTQLRAWIQAPDHAYPSRGSARRPWVGRCGAQGGLCDTPPPQRMGARGARWRRDRRLRRSPAGDWTGMRRGQLPSAA
jgi:hypothetical protein